MHTHTHTPLTKLLDPEIQGTEEHVKGHHQEFHQQNSACRKLNRKQPHF